MTRPLTTRFMDLAIGERYVRLTTRGRPGKRVWVKRTGDSARWQDSLFNWEYRIPMDTRVVRVADLNQETTK